MIAWVFQAGFLVRTGTPLREAEFPRAGGWTSVSSAVNPLSTTREDVGW
jgi:hypothetical protein